MKKIVPSAVAVLLFALLVPASLASPKEGFFRTSDGVRLHYLEAGSGQAIVFVPGWTMPAWIWQPQIEHFSRKYRVIALDPRSQGESEKPAEGHYPERRAQDIQELIGHLKLEKPVLVGWSMGVPELLTMVHQSGSENVGGLVLVDGMLWEEVSPEMGKMMRGWMKRMQTDREAQTREFVRSMYKKPQPEEYLERVTQAALKTPTNSAILLLMNWEQVENWRPVLEEIRVPVLFVGTPELQKTVDLVKSAIPSARVEIFAEAGHALFVDEAERFNGVVNNFLPLEPTHYRVNGTSSGSSAHGPDPSYTEEALEARIEGTVVIWAVIGADGHVQQARVIKPLGYGLDKQALKAVKSWQFTPATKDGKAVAVQVTIEVNFHLPPRTD